MNPVNAQTNVAPPFSGHLSNPTEDNPLSDLVFPSVGNMPVFRAAPGTLAPKTNAFGRPYLPGIGTGMPKRIQATGLPSEFTGLVLTPKATNPRLESAQLQPTENPRYIMGVSGPKGVQASISAPPLDETGRIMRMTA